MRHVYLDTCCVIYLIENVAGYSAPMREQLTGNRDATLCVSPLVRLEVLVKPLMDGNHALVKDYEDFLAQQKWLSMGDEVFATAVLLRAKHHLKTPDALHLATARHYDCDAFWTNDDRLKHAAAGMSVDVFAK